MALKGQLTTADFLPMSEFKKLLKGLRQDKQYIWELYARLSFYTACRASDVLKLRWCDVLKRKAQITEKKTGKTREIPFNAKASEHITRLYRLLGCPPVENLIFWSRATGEPICIQHVNRQFKWFKLIYQIKIDHFSTHTFRKTFGRYVYDSNGHSAESLLLLNRILKHSSIDTTKRYIGITKEETDSVFMHLSL